MFLTSAKCCTIHRVVHCYSLRLSTAQVHSLVYSPCGLHSPVVQQIKCETTSLHGEIKSLETESLRWEHSIKCPDHRWNGTLRQNCDLNEQFSNPHSSYSNCGNLDTAGLDSTSLNRRQCIQNLKTSTHGHRNQLVSHGAYYCDKYPAPKAKHDSFSSSPLLTLCDTRKVLLSRTLQLNTCVKRAFSHLCSTRHHCKHLQITNTSAFKRLLKKFENDYCYREASVRTSYVGSWDGPAYRKQPPWRILFFGTDFIALDTLKALHENMRAWSPVVGSLDVVTVKAQKPVRQYAKSQGLPLYDWPIKTDNTRYDVGVLVSFGHMIPDRIIHMFPYGILNMHPSVLPRWRGASPIIHAVLAGDKEMGVSITEIRPKHFDVGPILMQQAFPMPKRPTSMQVANVLGKVGAEMVLETLKDLPTLERYEHEQEMKGITYAHKISKQNGYIDWENSTAEEVDQQYRALSPIVPIRSKWKDLFVSLHDVVDPESLRGAQKGLHPRYKGDIEKDIPGTPVWHRDLDCIVIKCKEGLIGFKTLTLRRRLTPRDFHNGYLNAWDGTRFTSVHNELYRYVKAEKMPVTSTA